MSQTNDLLNEISGKLDKILKLLAIDAVKGINTEQGKIESLDLIGFRPSEIATLLNKSPDNISVQLNLIRKKKSKAVKTKSPEESQGQDVKTDSTALPVERVEGGMNEQ